MYPSYVNHDRMEAAFEDFHDAKPFNHCVVDDFVEPEFFELLHNEFLSYDSPKWFYYHNAIEDKKALNDWNAFPSNTYKFFSYLNSPEFVQRLSVLVGTPLFADHGLHGGGWHSHGAGGNLNPHFDYSIHPKAGLERKINIIIYASKELQPEHGGHLGLWDSSNGPDRPGELITEIQPRFNRAVIFDTTQQSWHGMSRPLTQPPGIFRKSFAIYYMCKPSKDASPRGRALFAPRDEQRGDTAIEELIRLRSGVDTSSKVYNSDK
jgi:Rps23 Pro-64 3,4-dihydroxylase Tpa1-like proline 4-hydroxylase